MECIIIDGKCPECSLKGKESSLHLNAGDYWECPECRLQLQIVTDDYIKIVDIRGEGKLRHHIYNPEISGEKILVKDNVSSGGDFIIKNEGDLHEILKNL